MYHLRDDVFVHKLNILYITIFTIVGLFSHMASTSQKWALLYGHETLIPVFQKSC